MNWKPVIRGTISVVSTANGGTVTTYVDNGNGGLVAVPAGGSVSRRTVMVQPVDDATNMSDLRLEGVDSYVETIVYNSTGAQVTATVGTIDYETGVITFTGVDSFPAGTVQIAYSYNNVNIPQNDLPILNAKIESMPLLAKPRRIAMSIIQ